MNNTVHTKAIICYKHGYDHYLWNVKDLQETSMFFKRNFEFATSFDS